MVRALVPISALLFAMTILLTGQGLQTTLLPVRADIEGYSFLVVGLMGAGYFAGFLLGCIMGPGLVRQSGHIRTFSALAAVASAAPLAHGLILEPVTWIALRFATGFCFSGLFMVIESWLNDRSTRETRGSVLSVYNALNLTALMGGQFVFAVMNPEDLRVFAVASILLSIALVPVALTRIPQPEPMTSVKIDYAKLWAQSPVGVVSAVAIGLVAGAFWTFSPVFARDIGFDIRGVALFMSILIFAAALVQVPLGRLSDLVDRRWVIVSNFGLSFLGGAGLLILSLLEPSSSTMTYVLIMATIYGAFSLSVYSIVVAHVNDRFERHEFVMTASGLLLLYGSGAVIGPVIAGAAVNFFGSGALFGVTGVIHLGATAFTIYRMTRTRAVPAEEREAFVSVPRTSPESAVLDPRSEQDTVSTGEAA